MPHMNTTRFDVEGRGTFPMDMLRFDRCFPISHEASRNMEPDITSTRVVQLEAVSPRGLITPERWQSFGWTVTLIND